jgi:hypothetical protein
MAAQLVPLTTAPNQSLTVGLNINSQIVTLQLRIYYNSFGGFWLMDIADKLGNPIVDSIPLLTGVWPGANILGAFASLQIGTAFVINLNGAASDWPDNTNLGSDFVLLWDSN